VNFAVEDYMYALPRMRDIYPVHWAEIAMDKDTIPLDPDYGWYEMLYKSGMLHLVCARDEGKLVGYHVGVLRPHPHYKSTLMCFSDMFYLLREYRRGMNGYEFMKFFKDTALTRGVKRIYWSSKRTIDITPIAKRLGFIHIENVFTYTVGG